MIAVIFGKPDGMLTRLRCRILGHAWECCCDVCCDGRLFWCRRCLMNDAHLQEAPRAEAISRHRTGNVGGFAADGSEV